MGKNREFDVVVYGATGFTGRLVAEYLNNQYGVGKDLKWAMAGRSEEKLASVRDEMGVPADVPFVVADASDPASLKAMAERTSVVLTTVGPYQLYGSDVVAACVAAGTDYVDLCGEVNWMHTMIAEHGDAAKKSGARIVLSCGFDSIPFDLGVYFLQENAKKTLGGVVPRVKTRVREMKGTFSGGTVASFRATMASVGSDPSVIEILTNPFALTEGFTGPAQPAGDKPVHEDDLGMWVAPFVMAPINTRNVHRSNMLLGHAYGEDFVYDEMMMAGPGEQGEAVAKMIAGDTSMMSDDAPKPGEGPSKKEREEGMYNVLLIGEAKDGKKINVTVTGDRDPGYGSTSKIIAEAAVCLAKDDVVEAGGIYTSAPAMGMKLVDRLVANAGLTFDVDA
ncbi:MAG: saccharopine dehydrogenase NADP-binding domain-containing protein [Alphaproteobacteria bacterium]|nr:saccharopine dehydrogenase NADP-binding domain-containing protein [Alphaproteobacteria bacterium]